MATRRLDQDELETYFNRIAKALGIRSVEIEVTSLAVGDQIEADWIGMMNISYDPKGDAIDISTDRLDHRILHPKVVYVLEGDEGLEAIEVERDDGTKEIVRLRAPLLLTGPAA
ncbi:DUF5335 family protein [Ferruginivarius sediminum]|uniref:Uncharacterized protein n=1 Tax=Ferruginivarius sediminum TaxID=2661937 RepID=A0A369TBI2_9PROT|nr:DUF5335 family protein [Ferruginivarius sediminum]RDD62638.1 hypothetical protein DRB17_05615 [Ferruginivarius sediminum]